MKPWKPPYAVTQLPVIGPWASRAGKVSNVFATPCDVEPIVAVEAAFRAIPYIAWAITKPDPQDLVTARFGASHRKRRKRGFNIFDLVTPVATPAKGSLGWTVWKVGDLAQRLGFYMMIIDATSEGIVYWTSAAYQMSGCRVHGMPAMTLDLPLSHQYGDGEWHTISFWHYKNGSNIIYTPFGFEILENTNAAFSLIAAIQPSSLFPDNFPSDIAFRIVNDTDGTYQEIDPVKLKAGEPNSAALILRDYGSRQWRTLWQVQYRATPGWFSMTGTEFSVTTVRDIGIDPDP